MIEDQMHQEKTNTEPGNDPDPERDAEFRSLINDYRSAVTHVAMRASQQAQTPASNWLREARQRERRRLMFVWSSGVAIVAAAVIAAVLLPGRLRGPDLTADTAASAASQSAAAEDQAQAPAAIPVSREQTPAPAGESDSALLEAVDTDVSASAPPALAPLVTMEAWDSGPGESSDAAETAPNPTENTNVAH